LYKGISLSQRAESAGMVLYKKQWVRMASDKGFGSYSGMPGDRLLFFLGTRYRVRFYFKESEECSCYSEIFEML